MKFEFTDEQEALRGSVRSFLERRSSETDVRRLMDTPQGYDPEVWTQMAVELELQGLAIPVEFGGSGASFQELCIVLEEAGRVLLCAPYFSTTVLAANALLLSKDADAQARWLPGIASGQTLATVAYTESHAEGGEFDVQAVATRSADGIWTIDGEKRFVLDGLVADLIIVAARTNNGISLFAIEMPAKGVHIRAQQPFDLTRKLAAVTLQQVVGTLIGTVDGGWGVLGRVLQLAAIGLAAEQVGGAQVALQMSVRHATERIQFGQPIGSFQAIKHKAASMLLDVESARSVAYYAAICADGNDQELELMSALAKSYCSEAFFRVAAANIQIHGGMGFTWEHPAHLYFRRAKSGEILFGSPEHHREVLRQQLLA